MPKSATVEHGRYIGDVTRAFQANAGRLDMGYMKPFIDPNTGRAFATVYMGGDPKKKSSFTTIPVTNATLRRDEWKELDRVVMEVAREQLGGVADLEAAGLTYNLGNGLATTILEWHDISDNGEAEMTMDGVNRGRNSQPDFQFNYLPIPIVHYDFELNARHLAASRLMGNPLDTIGAERASRRVAEKIESMLFKSDATYSFGEKDARGRNTIYSYTNFPDRNLMKMTTAWTNFSDSQAKGKKIVQDVLAMKQKSVDALHRGPWNLYIPSDYETLLDEDYSDDKGTNTIRQRILMIEGIKAVKVSTMLADNNVILVQMTRDVVRLVKGMGVQTVEWKSEGNLLTNYKVMTIQVPQIRSDQNGKCGIVHMSL
jgi:hypothetical protein